MTAAQAVLLSKDILFNNANVLYDLRYPLEFKEMGENIQKALAWHPKPQSPTQVYDVQVFENFKTANPSIEFVYIEWLDYMATMRVRIVPFAEFERLIKTGSRIGISDRKSVV